MNGKTLGSLVLAAGMLLAGRAWADPKFQSEMTVSGYSGTTTLTDFPVLVRISESAISGFSYDDCAADGSDISFAADAEGLTLLDYEIDTWNPEGESLVWVRLPSLSGQATKFYLRWNDADPASHDKTAVWPNFFAVWHMGDGGDATNSSPKTLEMDAIETVEGCSTVAPSSKVGAATLLTDGQLRIPDSGSFYNAGRTFSLSGWYKSNSSSEYQSLIGKDVSWQNGAWYLFYHTKRGLFFSSKGSDAVSCGKTAYPEWAYITISVDDGVVSYYQNGVKMSTSGKLASGKLVDSTKEIFLCGGYMDEIRISGGTMSADWVKADYETMTVASFIAAGERTERAASGIQVTGYPENLFPTNVTYGWTKGCVAGNEYTFAGYEGGYIDETEKKRSICTGWKLYDMDGNVERSSEDEGEETLSCTVTYHHAVRLEWQWATEVLLDVSWTENGTVTGGAKQWIVYGEDATLQAVPVGENSHFLRWSGDTLGLSGLENTSLSVPNVIAPRSLRASFWKEYRPTAGTDLAEIAAQLKNERDTVYLAAGTYPWTQSATLGMGARIIGAGRDKTFISGAGTAAFADTSALNLSHAADLLQDLTITNISGRGVYMANGTIRRCRITGCRNKVTSGSSRANGGGVYMADGLLADSEIDDCRVGSCTYADGGGLCMRGGLATNTVIRACNINNTSAWVCYGVGVRLYGGTMIGCEIRDNGLVDKGAMTGGIHCYDGTGAIIRNCLIANNRGAAAHDSDTSGFYFSSKDGLVENCTVADNSTGSVKHEQFRCVSASAVRNTIVGGRDNPTPTAPDMDTGSVTVTYCRYKEAVPTAANHNTTNEPHFRNPGAGDYRLTMRSEGLKGAGSVQSWMTGALDLRGKPRLTRRGKVDMGCYCYDPVGSMILIR